MFNILSCIALLPSPMYDRVLPPLPASSTYPLLLPRFNLLPTPVVLSLTPPRLTLSSAFPLPPPSRPSLPGQTTTRLHNGCPFVQEKGFSTGQDWHSGGMSFSERVRGSPAKRPPGLAFSAVHSALLAPRTERQPYTPPPVLRSGQLRTCAHIRAHTRTHPHTCPGGLFRGGGITGPAENH